MSDAMMGMMTDTVLNSINIPNTTVIQLVGPNPYRVAIAIQNGSSGAAAYWFPGKSLGLPGVTQGFQNVNNGNPQVFSSKLHGSLVTSPWFGAGVTGGTTVFINIAESIIKPEFRKLFDNLMAKFLKEFDAGFDGDIRKTV